MGAAGNLFVEAVIYRYRAGIRWRDLPERFGQGALGGEETLVSRGALW